MVLSHAHSHLNRKDFHVQGQLCAKKMHQLNRRGENKAGGKKCKLLPFICSQDLGMTQLHRAVDVNDNFTKLVKKIIK